MNSRQKRREKLNLSLETKEYRRLHLMLYLLSALLIAFVYFLTIILFSQLFNKIITVIVSFTVGLYLVYNRDRLTKQISNRMQDKKRRETKKSNKHGLETTLKRITPKRKLKLSVGGREPLKDRMKNLKGKFKKKNKKSQDYIEIE